MEEGPESARPHKDGSHPREHISEVVSCAILVKIDSSLGPPSSFWRTLLYYFGPLGAGPGRGRLESGDQLGPSWKHAGGAITAQGQGPQGPPEVGAVQLSKRVPRRGGP